MKIRTSTSHFYFFVMMTHKAWFPGFQSDTYLTKLNQSASVSFKLIAINQLQLIDIEAY